MSNDKIGILRFTPRYRTVRWGGERIAQFKNLAQSPGKRIGESWEISGLENEETVVAEGPFKGMSVSELLAVHGEAVLGRRLSERFGTFFPLLIKFIDAQDDLSIQVHPDDATAPNGHGKTELWYIIKRDPGAYIYSGFNRRLNSEKLRGYMNANRLVDVLAKHNPVPGDVFYLPAGRIHSIGGGNLILEIQQTSGTTYRLWDYNRRDVDGKPRELHIEQALEVIDYGQTDYGLARPQMLIDFETIVKSTPYFTVTALQAMQPLMLEVKETDSPRILVAIDGAGLVSTDGGDPVEIRRGQTLLVAADTDKVLISPTTTPLKLITVFIE